VLKNQDICRNLNIYPINVTESVIEQQYSHFESDRLE